MMEKKKQTLKGSNNNGEEKKTRAPKGSGCIRERNGAFELRYTQDGKAKSKTYHSRIEAEKARRRITAAIDAGTYVDPKKILLEDWLTEWLKTYCCHIKPGTLIQYEGYVKNHISPELGKIRLCNLMPHRVQRFINELSYHGKKKGKELSYKTRKNIHGCLSAALAKAVQIKYLADNPATGCNIPKDRGEQNEKEVNPLTTEEKSKFLAQIKDAKYRDIYKVALGTGMRLSEILGLRWSRVDFKKNTITVDTQLMILRKKGGKRKLAPTKNESTRTFKASQSVMNLLKDRKKQQASERLAAGSAWQYEIEDLVFTNIKGDTIPHASVEHEYKKVIMAAGCQDHRFHDIRHTFATTALRVHADIKTLSRTLGHRSVAFTLDVYGHVCEEMADEFADLMDNIIATR